MLSSESGTRPGPRLVSATFFGGSGNQQGRGIAVRGDQVYVAGYDDFSSRHGFLLAYDVAPSAPVWVSRYQATSIFRGVAVSGATVYAAGGTWPPVCGASDGAGGTEEKAALVRYGTGGTLLGCRSANFFSYRGEEKYWGVLAVHDGSALYTLGQGEEVGFGGQRTILARYDPDGTLLWKRKYGTDVNGNPTAGTYIRNSSRAHDAAWMNGYLYIAGLDRGVRGGGRGQNAMLLKYDAAVQSPDPDPNAVGAGILVPEWSRVFEHRGSTFRGLTDLDGAIYVAGTTWDVDNIAGSSDYLLQRYDEFGDVVWTQNFGTSVTDDALADVIAVGERLYAVGATGSEGADAHDVIVMEIDPTSGAVVSSTTTEGGLAAGAWGVTGAATNGADLYVVGTSKSFTGGGNQVGERDVMLLRYVLTITVEDQIQRILDDVQDLVAEGELSEDKGEDVNAKLETVLEELEKDPPDNQAAVGNIEGAVGDLEAAVDAGELDPEVGEGLMDDLAEVARGLAEQAITDANNGGGDWDKIAEAQASLAEGDALRAWGDFKDAVNKYKDALAQAEGA
jgi:hypothetical protein